MRGRRLIRLKDRLVARQTRITPNHPALIRSFLIDSGRLRLLYDIICAKLFRRADARAATGVNARVAKKFAAQTRARQNTVVTKTLILSCVFNFFDACAFKRRVPSDRANSFNFDRTIE